MEVISEDVTEVSVYRRDVHWGKKSLRQRGGMSLTEENGLEEKPEFRIGRDTYGVHAEVHWWRDTPERGWLVWFNAINTAEAILCETFQDLVSLLGELTPIIQAANAAEDADDLREHLTQHIHDPAPYCVHCQARDRGEASR